MTFTNWSEASNKDGNEQCVQMGTDGKWNEIKCDLTVPPQWTMCEKILSLVSFLFILRENYLLVPNLYNLVMRRVKKFDRTLLRSLLRYKAIAKYLLPIKIGTCLQGRSKAVAREVVA